MSVDQGAVPASERDSTGQTCDQLWKTWCYYGLEQPGHQVRAASGKLRDVRGARYARLQPHLYYGPPKGVGYVELLPSDAPVALTFLDFGDERVLARIRLTNHDRPGDYFVHVLAGLPATFSARRAIAAWAWDGWREEDSALPAHSLDLEPIPLKSLPETADWGNHPWSVEEAEYLAFAIEAYLALEPQQRLYLAASSLLVARLIDGVLNALPNRMVATVTFATYLANLDDHLRATPKIIGTWWPSEYRQRLDLGDHHYGKHRTRWGLALNTFTGDKSPLARRPEAAAYAAFAVDCLAGGQPGRLADFLERADLADVATVDELLALARYADRISVPSFLQESRPTSVDPDVPILPESRLIGAMLDQRNLRHRIRTLARDNHQAWQGAGETAIRKLAASAARSPFPHLPEALAALADEAVDDAVGALAKNRVDVAKGMLNLALAADPVRSNELQQWLAVESKPYTYTTIDAETTGKPVYEWLLQLAAKTEGIEVRDVRKWLAVSNPNLPWLLSLHIPDPWKVEAIQFSIMNESPMPSDTLADLLMEHRVMLRDALMGLLSRAEASQFIVGALRAMLRQQAARPQALNLAELLLDQAEAPASLVSELLRVLDQHLTHEELQTIFSRQPLAFMGSAQRDKEFWGLVRWYLDTLTAERACAGNTTATLRLLATERSVPQTIRELAERWHAIATALAGMDSPTWKPDLLLEALQHHRNREFGPRVLPSVGRALGTRITSYKQLKTTIDELHDRCGFFNRFDIFRALLRGAFGDSPQAEQVSAFIRWVSLQAGADPLFRDLECALGECQPTLLSKLHSHRGEWGTVAHYWWAPYYRARRDEAAGGAP